MVALRTSGMLYSAYSQSTRKTTPDPAVNPRNDGDGLGEVERIRLWVHEPSTATSRRKPCDFGRSTTAAPGMWLPDGQTDRIRVQSQRTRGRRGREPDPALRYLDAPISSGPIRAVRWSADSHAAVVPAVQANDGRRIAYLAAPMTGPHAVNMELTTVDHDRQRSAEIADGRA